MVVRLSKLTSTETNNGHSGNVLCMSPRLLVNQIRRTVILVTLLVATMWGCTEKLSEQVGSLTGGTTDRLRDFVREDPDRHRLLVFVHGFNSAKDTAWGDFLNLIREDPAFDEFNIHRFGYPTKLCRQVSDIRNQGGLLASVLESIFTNTKQTYRQVVLVGHSMGGLVILEALLKLERDHLQLLKEQDLKILTFGTPYQGVENTDVLTLFCDNQQVNDMRALNDKLGELSRNWTQRFNQNPTSDGRDTPQIPIYAFRGNKDRFITETSACGYPQTPCEQVDGDHMSQVKPTSRSHLAYQKLHHLATQSINQQSLVPPLQVMSVIVDEERSSFLMKETDQSIHGVREGVVRKSLEYDRSMYDVSANSSCRGMHGESPIVDALPVWRDLLKKRGRPDLVKQLNNYEGYRKLISSGPKLYLDARPTAAEVVTLLKHEPDLYKLLMRWQVECIGISDPVLIWTLQNNSKQELIVSAIDYKVLDVGKVMGGIPRTLEPMDVTAHDLVHTPGTQTRQMSPQIVLPPGSTAAIRIRYQMAAGAGLTWLVKPVFRTTLQNISAEGPELKIFSGKGK